MARRPDTRQRIEAAALALFAAKGVDATTTRDIAGRVGISDGAIYRHFPSKDALVRALFLGSYADLAERLEAILAAAGRLDARIAAMVDLFCAAFDADRDRFTFVLLSQHRALPAVDGDAPNPVAVIQRMFADGVAEGACRREDPALLAAIALGIVLQPATFVLYGRLPAPMAPLRDRLVDAVRKAVA